jgi:hypothetical protein
MQMTNKTTSAGLCLLMVLGAVSILPAGVAGDAEPNDDFATAEMITPGLHSGQLNYSIDTGDRYDYYKFAVAEGQRFTVNGSAGTGIGVMFHLADPNQAFILESSWLGAGSYQVLNYTLGHGTAGDYYLWFEIGGADGWANYSFELYISDQSDAGQAGDAGDANTTARTITPGTYYGWLDSQDQDDYYIFNVPPGNRIDLAFTPSENLPSDSRMKLELDRPDGNPMNGTDWYGPGGSGTLTHQTSVVTGGTYYVKMSYMTAGGNYTLTLALVPENDAGSGGDAAGDLDAGPYQLPGSGTYDGVLHDDDAVDCYIFNVTAGQIISCNLTIGMAESDQVQYMMYRPDMSEYKRSEWFNPGESKQIGLVTNNSGSGNWLLKVMGRNIYTFDLTLEGQNDSGVPGDAGDTIATARPILPDTNYTGLQGDDDQDDFYSFNGVENSIIKVSFVLDNGGRIALYGPDSELVHVPAVVGQHEPASFSLMLEDTGTFYMQVNSAITGLGKSGYVFNLTVAAADTQLPAVAITTPPGGTTVNVSALNLSGTASDNKGVAKVELSLDGIAWFLAAGTTSWTISGFVLSEGNNTVRARATDTSNNTNTTSISVRYLRDVPAIDTEKPSVKVVNPSGDFTSDADHLSVISGTATDNVGVVSVRLYRNGHPVPITFSNGTWKANNIALVGDSNNFTVIATDAAGNSDTDTIRVVYEKPSPGFDMVFVVAAVVVCLVVLKRRRT